MVQQRHCECPKPLPWWATSFQNVLTLVVIIGAGYVWWRSDDSQTRSVTSSMITMVLGYHYGAARSQGRRSDNS